MGIGVYTKEDAANILKAVAEVDLSAQAVYFEADGKFQSAYHIGFQAALTAMGLAFGLGPKIEHWRAEGPTWIGVKTNG